METNGKTLAFKGFLCYNTAVYAKNTQRGFLGWCPKEVSRREEALRKKKTKNGGLKNERNFNETVTRSRCTLWTSDKKMEP